jgi:hypothetical protein
MKGNRLPMSKTCIFCDATLTAENRSKEHVFPEWLLDELRIQASDQYFGLHNVDFEDQPKSERLQGAHTLVQGNVCTGCNNGWMSDLETRDGPLLRIMDKLEQVRLSRDDSVLLATWMFKTLILYSVTTNYRKIVPDSVFHYVRLNLMPPPGNHVEIAYAPDAPKGTLRTRLTPVKFAMFDKDQCDSAYINSQLQQSYVLCAQVGRLPMRVVGLPRGGMWRRCDAEQGNMLRLFPNALAIIDWPKQGAYHKRIEDLAFGVALGPIFT